MRSGTVSVQARRYLLDRTSIVLMGTVLILQSRNISASGAEKANAIGPWNLTIYFLPDWVHILMLGASLLLFAYYFFLAVIRPHIRFHSTFELFISLVLGIVTSASIMIAWVQGQNYLDTSTAFSTIFGYAYVYVGALLIFYFLIYMVFSPLVSISAQSPSNGHEKMPDDRKLPIKGIFFVLLFFALLRLVHRPGNT